MVWSSSGKLSAGESNLVPERITLAQDNSPHWDGGSSRWLQFIVINILSVLSFLESKVIVK
jgi:hypothetical protein